MRRALGVIVVNKNSHANSFIHLNDAVEGGKDKETVTSASAEDPKEDTKMVD